MADVTGDLGGQPIQLNNAATEATLKQLLAYAAAIQKQGSEKVGKNVKVQKDLEKELKRLAVASKKAADEASNSSEELKKETKLRKTLENHLKDNAEALKKQKESIEKVTNNLEKYTDKIVDAASSIANLGNSVTSAASALGKIPVVGGMLSATFSAVASSAEKTYKAFQQSASVGANFGGSITDMVNSATNAGLTFDQFSSIIAKNSENLIYLGKTTGEGAKRMSEVSKNLRSSGLADELYRLGFSAEDVNTGIAQFSARMTRASGITIRDTNLLAQANAEYLKNLDAVSRLTGKSKESLQAEADARMADAQFRSVVAKMGADGEKVNQFLSTLPKGLQEGAQELFATGTATSEAGQKFIQLYPEAAQAFAKIGAEAQRTGQFTKESARILYDSTKREAQALAKTPVAETLGKFNKQYNDVIVGTYELANRQGQFADAYAEQQKTIKDAIDPAVMQRFMQSIAELSNKFSILIGQNLPKLVSVFDNLSSLIEGPLGAAFNLIIDNIGKIATAFVALKVAQVVYQKRLEEAQFRAASWGKDPSDARWVRDVSGGGGGGAAGGSGGDSKGSGKWKNIVKGLGWGVIAGVATDAATSALEKSGHEKSAAGVGVAGSAAQWGLMGSMLGPWGAVAGAVLGGGVSLFQNWNKLTGKSNELTKQDNELTKELLDAKQKDIQATKDAAEGRCQLPNWLNPEETLRWHMGLSAQPGAGAAGPGGTASPIAAGEAFKGTQKEFYDKMYSTLLDEAKKQGVANPEVIARLGAAQSAQETGFGKHTAGSQNYFGIKAKPGDEGSGGVSTQEFINGKWVTIKDKFRKYGSMGESAADYVKFLQQNKRYQGVLSAKTVEEAIAAQGRTGYATDPGYANKLARIHSKGLGGTIENGTPPVLTPAGIATALPAGRPGSPSANYAARIAYEQEQARLTNQDAQSSKRMADAYKARGLTPPGMPSLEARRAAVNQLRSVDPNAAIDAQLASMNQEKTPKATLPSSDTVIAASNIPAGRPGSPSANLAAKAAALSQQGQPQETTESLLSSLNNKIDQMVQMNSRLNEINERQLNVQKGLSSNLYAGF